ncbi:EAL domain-containing protein [Pseudomonas petrae]|uniref:cyclic-guanylate-specific phosphodiesterase n=1 Tax=Pseudomonas petrae TaxID=2912190 RepID=A0ABS9I8C4_9PSED|nr:EAL domain-containing protein [Pseudomonas petrae]MCF7539531.1 EAL domain-containing protein [Pseudomonas petrae]MCF7544014.1 EAL domain-containing protein [Pseudomonas petrae]MCF7558180.1 EAL domain-containing protein [Pseudomonas petrae]
MRKSRVIIVAILSGLIGAVLPMITMAYISWERALAKERTHLETYSERALKNISLSLQQGLNVISDLESWSGVPCSPEHISLMQKATVNTRAVEEIDYLEYGLLSCTSWGVTSILSGSATSTYTNARGYKINVRLIPSDQGIQPITVIHRGAYKVLINAGRLSDIILDDRMQLGVFYQGQLVNISQGADEKTISRLVSSQDRNNEDYLYAVSTQDDWSALVAEPIKSVDTSFYSELAWMLPIGIGIGFVVVLSVIRIMRIRLSPMAEMQIAIAQREFTVHYQPIIDLETEECTGAEALVRWLRPDGTVVSPDQFIPLAEETGLILPITDQVICGVVKDMAETLRKDRNFHVAINICADDLKSGRFLDTLDHALKGSMINSSQIWIEATERGFIDVESAVITLKRARALGFKIAIDDFGTGYSSLQYLERLPVNVLKIDKSFVDAIDKFSASSSVVTHIIAMAKKLGLEIVAEGIESPHQADYLRAYKVDYAQGWLYSKALPAHDFLNFISTQKTAGESPRCDTDGGGVAG